MEFTYVAANDAGIKQNGKIEARTEKEIVEFLKKNKLTPISIKRKIKSSGLDILSFKKIHHSDIVMFTRQLSSMINTGLTLIESLNILKKQSGNPQMEALIEDLLVNISEGMSFSQALSNHKDVFSDTYTALIKASETGGLLDKLLSRLADNLEKSEEIKSDIRTAMFYPMIIVTGMIGIIAIMNIFVIPPLGSIYEAMNLDLPIFTKVVLAISKFTISFWPVVLASCIIFIIFFKQFSKTVYGIRVIDKVKMKTPILGNVFILSSLAQITSTLSLLIRSGASILEALNISANVSQLVYHKDAIKASEQLVEKGVSMSTAFQNQNIFPLLMVQMTKVGEETGKIDDNLERVSEYFQRELNNQVKALTSGIEPILIVVLGVTIGFLILSVMMPIFNLMQSIK